MGKLGLVLHWSRAGACSLVTITFSLHVHSTADAILHKNPRQLHQTLRIARCVLKLLPWPFQLNFQRHHRFSAIRTTWRIRRQIFGSYLAWYSSFNLLTYFFHHWQLIYSIDYIYSLINSMLLYKNYHKGNIPNWTESQVWKSSTHQNTLDFGKILSPPLTESQV